MAEGAVEVSVERERSLGGGFGSKEDGGPDTFTWTLKVSAEMDITWRGLGSDYSGVGSM